MVGHEQRESATISEWAACHRQTLAEGRFGEPRGRQGQGSATLLGSVLVGDSWLASRVLLIAAMGEELTDDERKLFKQLTQRKHEPGQRVESPGGAAAKVGASPCWPPTSPGCEHPSLVHGERGVFLIIAPDQKQASVTLEYCAACFEASEVMAGLVEHRTADSLQLVNGIAIEVRSSSFRRLRGPSYIGACGEEVAFLYSDEFSSNADVEIINAVRPGLATTGDPLILVSSPYAKRGVLWAVFESDYGPEGDPLILVAKGTSREFNPSLSQRVVDRAMERDEVLRCWLLSSAPKALRLLKLRPLSSARNR